MKANPWWATDTNNVKEMPDFSHQIYQTIEAQSEQFDNNIYRASSMGKCSRQLMYKLTKAKGKPLPPRAQMVFTTGHMIERALREYIEMACGEGKVYKSVSFGEDHRAVTVLRRIYWEWKKESLLKFFTNSIKLIQSAIKHNDFIQPTWINTKLDYTAHPDCIFEKHDGSFVLGEIKSTTPYGLKEFKENGPGDYIYQVHASMMTDEARAMDIKEYHFIYLDKMASHIWDRRFMFDSIIENKIVKKIAALRKHEHEETLPEPGFEEEPEMFRRKPTGNITLPWQCGYCAYVDICRPDFKLDFKKDGFGNFKPKYIKHTNL